MVEALNILKCTVLNNKLLPLIESTLRGDLHK